MPNTLPIFISYAHKDEPYLKELQIFLRPLERSKTIKIWTDKNIVAGQQWDAIIKKQLANSKIILFLVSPDFLASDYIHDTEITDALNNQQAQAIVIISIIIRPIDMTLLQVKAYQVVPTDAKAVSDWDNRDKAWNDVLKGLSNVFRELNNPENALAHDPAGNNTVNALLALNEKHASSKVVVWLFILLIAACIGLFVIGIVNRDSFFCFASLGGISAGILGLFMSKKA